jgi:pseudomonalisin
LDAEDFGLLSPQLEERNHETIFRSVTMRNAKNFLAWALLATWLPNLCPPTVKAQTLGWVSTATKAVGPQLLNATPQGLLAPSTAMHIAVGLKLRNQSALVQYVNAVSDPANSQFGNWLTTDQFVASYGPTAAQVASVENYLTAAGFTNVQAEPNNLFVTADGTPVQVQSAFNTLIGSFAQNGATVYANLSDAQVPSSLGGIVASVLGLNNAGKMSPPTHVQPAASASVPAVHFYTPRNFWTAYDVGATPTGNATTIAIFAEGDLTQVIKDLRVAESVNQLAQVPVQIVQVGIASTDTSGQDEWDLDTQMSSGMAGTVHKLVIYDTTSLSDSDVALMFNKFAHQNIAKAGSASFGLCEEFAFLDGSMLADDQVFLEAAAQGQTVFASTGDNGSACPVGAGANGVPLSGAAGTVLYPASSPYVVGVGGTTLFTNSDFTYNREIGWDAGGGGTSAFESSPFWQAAVSPTSAAGKGVPDVSMDADIVSGALTYIGCTPNEDPNNCQFIVGGTSLASPLTLGVWARLLTSHGNKLGFASPLFYKHATPLPSVSSGPGFHDIVGGCNGLFCAIPGYDYVTGLGTFDVAQMNGAIGH